MSALSSRHLLNLELLSLLDAHPTQDVSASNLDTIRANSRRLAEADLAITREFPGNHGVCLTEQWAPGIDLRQPAVRLMVYTPDGPAPDNGWPCYISIHGGGFIVGNPDQHDQAHRELARRHTCMVVAPAYRLAPESPYPASLHDCAAALRWAHTNNAPLGIDPARVVIGGESAGGGLAAAVTLFARDQGNLPLAGTILVYPMLDDRTGAGSNGGAYTGEFMWTRNSNQFAWRCYLGPQYERGEPDYAAPARMVDLSNLPPCHIFVGALDLFRDESIEYANRLMHQGVPTNLHVYAGACHAFDLAPTASVTQRFKNAFHDALQQTFSGKTGAEGGTRG